MPLVPLVFPFESSFLITTMSWLLLGILDAIAFLAIIQIKPEQTLNFLAVGLIIAAFIYVGFAFIFGATPTWVLIEIAGIGVYSSFASLGLWYSTRWLLLGWLAHPMWDLGLHVTGHSATFTPIGYVLACVSFDLVVAVFILGRDRCKLLHFTTKH